MSSTDWSSLKVVDLRAELSSRGLPTKGVKADLIQRLTEADADAAATATEQSGADEQTVDEPESTNNVTPEEEEAKEEAVTEPLPTSAENFQHEPKHEEAPVKADEVSSQEPYTGANAARLDDSEQPSLPTPSNDAADLQKRKRRSSTPDPSAKRVRQVVDRQASEHEDIVDYDNGDLSGSPQKRAEDDAELNKEVAYDSKIQDDDQRMEDAPNENHSLTETAATNTVEISGADANAERLVIAKSFDSSAPISQSSEVDVSGEEAFMKRVAIGRPSEERQTTFRPRHSSVDKNKGHVSQGASKEASTGDDGASLPSIHPPTSALYIRELMRPLKAEMVEQYIVDLITPSGKKPDPDAIVEFYLDQIRTHAFVQLSSISAAQRVRAALHNQRWPNESNRKALWVDFIPPSQFKEFIDREESAPRGNAQRWEVVYEKDGHSVVVIHQEIGADNKPFSKPPPTGPAAAADPQSAAAGPVYPGIEAAPRGPRGRGGRPFGVPGTRQTQAHPQLSYTPLNDEVARQRIDNMRSFYARAPPADLGKDYYRFSFENGHAFVDRGKEVFIGIRPPHRQKEHEERMRRERGLGGQGNDFRRDDFRPPPRPPITDEDRFSRNNGGRRSDRPPRDRGFRGPGRFRGEDPYRYRPGY